MVAYLVDKLKTFAALDACHDSRLVWIALQHECALERIFYGKLYHSPMTQYSINMGPGGWSPSRSATDYLGFIALRDPQANCAEEHELPPLKTWISNKKEVSINFPWALTEVVVVYGT